MSEEYWVCDAHCHMGNYGVFHIPRSDAESMIEAMDRCGVAVAVCSHHLSIGPETSLGNRLVAEAIEKYPDRLRGWLAVNPHRLKETEQELARYSDHPGFVGVKLHPDLLGARVDCDGFLPAWAWCEERRKPLLSHTWEGSAYDAPEMFVPLTGRFPHVPIIIGHSGGTYAGHTQTVELAKKYPNFYLDLTNSLRYLRRIPRIIEGVGADHVLFGSDMPFLSLPSGLGAVLYADISAEDRRLVLGENARRLLAL
ncbi:MAG: amidohydrolase family protein [bacterium]